MPGFASFASIARLFCAYSITHLFFAIAFFRTVLRARPPVMMAQPMNMQGGMMGNNMSSMSSMGSFNAGGAGGM